MFGIDSRTTPAVTSEITSPLLHAAIRSRRTTMVVSCNASIVGRHSGGRRWWRAALLSRLLAGAAPAAAKERTAFTPAGTASWPEMLRRDPAVINALGGR